jgi:DUF1009 family protein
MDKPLGLIAGEGEFPLMVLRGAKAAGRKVTVVGLRDCYRDAIKAEADVFYEAGIARLGRWIRVLRREGVAEAIMAGRVAKTRIVALPRWRQILAYMPDWTSIKVYFFRTRDRRNDSLLGAVADEMQGKGISLIDSTAYCRDALAEEGMLTRGSLSAAQSADARFGWKIAKEMGRLDVGQAVAIKDQDVLAVEAIEGTDAMIDRTGPLCRSGGWTLVKVAKPNQDMRFDVPTIGPGTIERMAAAGGKIIAIEAGKTLILERERTLELAQRHGVLIVGLKNDE